MQENINNDRLSIKKAFTTNKIAIIIMGYVFLLVWFKPTIFSYIKIYGIIKTIIALLIIPFTIFIFLKIRNYRNFKKKRENFSVVRQLNENQKFLLRKNVPTAQLPLVNDILLISLGLTFDVLSNIRGSSQGKTLFEEKFNQLVSLLKNISQRQEFISNTIAERSKNNALMIFAFYRILFHEVIEKAVEQNILAKDVDRWILLKRIPPKLSIYLGAQSWRLYELTTLIFGDLSCLKVNNDIKEAMMVLCTHQLDKSENSINPIVEENKHQKEVPIISHQEENADSGIIQVQKNNHNSIEESDNFNDGDNKLDKDKEFIKKFNRWLQRQVKRYAVNQYERFFMSMKDYGKNKLFITDTCLSDFCKKDNINIELCKELLIENGSADSSVFYLKRNNKEDLKLLSIHIDFSVDITQLLNGKIVRCKNGSSYISEASKS